MCGHLGLGQSRLLDLQLGLQQFEVLGPAFSLGVTGSNSQVIVQRHLPLFAPLSYVNTQLTCIASFPDSIVAEGLKLNFGEM